MRTLQASSTTIQKARCLYYDFFSRVFLYELLESSHDQLMSSLTLMIQSPLEDTLKNCYQNLINQLENGGIKAFKQAYTSLFIMPTHHEKAHLILSHYTSQNVGGDILLDIKAFFRQLSIRLNQDFCKESEEHFGFLMLLMGYLITHEESTSQELFSRFIAPFGSSIAITLEQSTDSIYADIGHLLEAFMEFENNIHQNT